MNRDVRARWLRWVLAALIVLPPAPAWAEGRGVYESVPLHPKDKELVKTAGDMEELFVRRGVVLSGGTEVDLVKRVGAAVAPKEPRDSYQQFRFGVIDSAIPNAFALPDGQVYVHSGLLAILENEAQLASVLAHECMHVEGHHSILHARQARKKAGGMLALGIALGQIGSLINIAFMAAIIGYGRDLETEADHLAIPRVLESGYDPREMPRVFELLDQDPEGDVIERKSATWSDHPLGRERRRYSSEILDGMAERIAAAGAAPAGLALGEEGFLAQVAPSAKKSVTDFIAWDRPRTALAIAHRLTTDFPQDPDGWALTGDVLVALDARTPMPEPEELTKDAKRAKHRDYGTHTAYERAKSRLSAADASSTLATNRALAEETYKKSLEFAPEHPAALAGLGRLAELRGNDEHAGRLYARFLRVAPEADPQRPAILRRLQVLTERLKDAAAAKTSGGTP